MPRRRQPRRAAAIGLVVVAALALVSGALAALALQSVEPMPIDRTPEPEPTFSFGQPTSTPSPSVDAEPASTDVLPRAEQRILVFGSDPSVAWRAIEGSCAEDIPPLIERSADGGATWTDVTPRYRDVRQVLTLEPFAGNQAQAVMVVGDDCEVDGLRTFTQGQFWEPYTEVLSQATYVSPDDAKTVVTPDGEITVSCDEPRHVRVAASELVLICDGDLQRFADGVWITSGFADVVALSVGFDGQLLVSWRTPQCDGLATSLVSAPPLSIGSCTKVPEPTRASASARAEGRELIWNGDTVNRGLVG